MKIFLMMLTVAFQFTLWGPLHAAADTGIESNTILKRLAEESNGTLEVGWNEHTKTPSLLTGRLSKPSKHSPQWIAYEFLNKTKKLYGLSNPSTDMRIEEITEHPDVIQVRMQHLLYKAPVWGDKLTVDITREGVIRRVEGRIYPDLKKKTFHRPMYAAISEKKAIAAALSFIKEQGIGQEVTKVQAYYLPSRSGIPLIYAVTLRNSEYKVNDILVHSLTGRVIDQQ